MSSQAAKPPSARIDYLDFIKGFAIISVVLLHTLPSAWLNPLLSVFHIWQAVPLFMFVAGITGCITWERRKKDFRIYYKDLPAKAWTVYLPYVIAVVLYQIYVWEPVGAIPFIRSILYGQVGPGGYFVSLIVQHMIFFPLLLRMRDKLNDDKKFLLYCLLLSALVEWLSARYLCTDPSADNMYYRFFYGRYLFVTALGAVFYNNEHLFSPATLNKLMLASIVYMVGATYMDIKFSFIPYEWAPQHYPAYFYTYVLVQWLRDNRYKAPQTLHNIITTFGKNSYEIFITQLFVFSTFGAPMRHSFFGALLLPFICLHGGLGVAYAKSRFGQWRKGLKKA